MKLGSMCTASHDRTTIRTAFLRIASGMITSPITTLVQVVRRKRYAIRRPLIGRDRLDRMPLHS
jgi:hypothetical protein